MHQKQEEEIKQSAYEMSLFGEQQQQNEIHKKFIKAPFSTALMNFSKIPGKVKDFFHQGPDSYPKNESDIEFYNQLFVNMEPSNIHTKTNDGFEMVIQSAQLGPKPVVNRCNPVVSILKDPEGRILNVDELKISIFKGVFPYHQSICL